MKLGESFYPIKANANQVSMVDCQWPPGTWVSYHSTSMGNWVASVIAGHNDDGSVNLNNKPYAAVDRIRARLFADGEERAALIKKMQEQLGQHFEMKCTKCGRMY